MFEGLSDVYLTVLYACRPLETSFSNLNISPCSRVIQAATCKVIVVPVIGDDVEVQLREQDLSWKDFLSSASQNFR